MQLYAELQKMEKESGVVLPDSPTLRVGGEPLTAFAPAPPPGAACGAWIRPRAREELARLGCPGGEMSGRSTPGLPPLSRTRVEYKFDGLTLNLTYEGGVLVEAATRGNGEVGEAILAQVRTIRGVPLSIPLQGKLGGAGRGHHAPERRWKNITKRRRSR